METATRKLYNPKSSAPAAYIACWLIQVPHTEMSYFSKMLYGRLANWCNSKGYVSRSAPQLGLEMGCHPRTIERGLKELRDLKLIETYQSKNGGANCFVFLDHEFMHRPLQDCLDYYQKHAPVDNPEYVDNSEIPPDRSVGTPPTELSVPPDRSVGHKYNKIKKIEKDKSLCLSADQKQSTAVDNPPVTRSSPLIYGGTYKPYGRKEERQEPRSTVKFWGPGHPDYDRINGLATYTKPLEQRPERGYRTNNRNIVNPEVYGATA